MEYAQMTLTDWMEVKHRLKMELQGVKQSFVRIGYVLRKIDEQRLFENDGYKSVAEFAKAEYGLESSTVSRFMSINREYSIDGYSEHLREEYMDLSRSQLEEMLKLPVEDRAMIRPETARDDIRELKKFNKTEPVAGVADDIVQLIEKFYKENPGVLNELFDTETPPREQSVKRAIEVVNPSGNRSFKKGLYFMLMYENKVVIKKFGGIPEEMPWGRFFEITFSIFEDFGPKTWEKHFGGITEPVAEEQNEKINREPEVKVEPVAVQEEKEIEKSAEKEPEKEIARAQKNEENQEFAGDSEYKNEAIEEQIPGQMEVADYPEMMPEASMAAAPKENAAKSQQNEPKKVETETPKTVFDTFRDVKKLEETVISETDAIRRTFMVFSRGKMPIGELEVAKEQAEKALEALNMLICIKKGEKNGTYSNSSKH